MIKKSVSKVIALSIFAVVAGVGVLGVSAFVNRTASIEALKSGNIANYKAEVIKERTAEITKKVNAITEAQFQSLQTKAPQMEAMNNLRLEFVAKATELVKAGNKEGFKTLVKENRTKMETFKKAKDTNNIGRDDRNRSELTDSELEIMYNLAVESVKNGGEIDLKPSYKKFKKGGNFGGKF